jgi:hypothetical protein
MMRMDNNELSLHIVKMPEFYGPNKNNIWRPVKNTSPNYLWCDMDHTKNDASKNSSLPRKSVYEAIA